MEAMWPDLSSPSELEMEAINDSEQLDQILVHSQQNSQPILIDWFVLLTLILSTTFSFIILHTTQLEIVLNVVFNFL